MHSGGMIPLISFIAAVFVANESFPMLKIPLYFLIGAGLLIIFLFFSLNLLRIREKIRGTTLVYLPLIFTCIFFLVAAMNSPYSTHSYYQELFNLSVVALIIILQLLIISNKEQLLKHRNQFFRILFYLVTFISLAGLCKFILYLRGIDISAHIPVEQWSLGTSLISNSDIFIIAFVAAMTGVILFKFRQKSSLIMSVIYHISFLVMFYTVIWSGSRKGLLLMILLAVVLVVTRVYFLIHSSRVRNYNLIKNLNILILVLGFSALIGTWALNLVPGPKKEEWILRLGFNRYHFKSEITLVTFEHISVFNPNADLQKWYDNLWKQNTPEESALKDKISFVLIEQENISTAPEKHPWTEKAYSNRKENWHRSLEIFTTYTNREKIFGKGFRYLDEFHNLPPDEPSKKILLLRNNYLVSSLMYSGIAGLVVLLLLILQVLRIYFINRKLLLALFTIFVLISSLNLLFTNTILSSPLLLIALIIPLRYKKA